MVPILFVRFLFLAQAALSVLTVPLSAQEYTRGIGVYPGDPAEDFSPSMRVDRNTYRNLALHRPVSQSGNYDYNLTGQLITDGIVDLRAPGYIVTSGSNGSFGKNQREWILDRQPISRLTVQGRDAWIQTEMHGSSAIPAVDSISITGTVLVDTLNVRGWSISVRASTDGKVWTESDSIGGDGLPGDTLSGWWRRVSPRNLHAFTYSFTLKKASPYRFFRAEFHSPTGMTWNVGEFGMFTHGKRAAIGGPYEFFSAWKSQGTGAECLSVDLGAECSIDRITLHWIHKASSGAIQVSNDESSWTSLAALPLSKNNTEDFRLGKAVKARFVRVLMKKAASADGYVMSELQVFGRGGPVLAPHPQASSSNDGRTFLSGGAWRLQRASEVRSGGKVLSKPGYKTNGWLVATVPGTVLTSYVNAGALLDPDFADNQTAISESYFSSNFWYRDEFVVPEAYKGRRTYLNFDGIDWKAEVYLNGQRLGRIEGAFTRGRFEVTDLLSAGKTNALAVLIEKNATPGYVTEQTQFSPDPNGGELGADNPTFHATVGWDWIPTIRGRDIGIWRSVYLSESGPVTIGDPLVAADLPLPDTSSADVNIVVPLHNHDKKTVAGVVRGSFGDSTFEQQVTLNPSDSTVVTFRPSTHPSLHLIRPRLWWANGYGAQNLYPVKLAFITAGGKESDSKSLLAGVREMTYSEEGGTLRIWINGKRFIGRGGNWGFPESMLRYRAREYDAAVRYHKEMNFTMIRNWVGQTGDDEFFEACDRYGIMVWQDFWLANPLDGPDPANPEMFLRNAEDFIRRIRNHPSLALYCGRNEGDPPEPIDTGLRTLVSTLHPALHYISNSAFGVVSGGGPYRAMPLKFYFEHRATEKLHSEIGMPNIVSYESLQRMMPYSSVWPQGELWGIHDYCLEGAQGGSSFNEMISESFGPVDNVRDWLKLAQWINYQGYRGMFEAQSKNRMGALLWMSHPAWPSLVWQTYDYYFEPTAAYFGCKKASEPLHIQWNPLSDSIEVVNYSDPRGAVLTATMDILNLDGTLNSRKSVSINCPRDGMVRCFPVGHTDSLTAVYFIRLRLTRGGEEVSTNFYWRGTKEGDLTAIRKLPKVKLEVETQEQVTGNRRHLTSVVRNKTGTPALMVRLKVTGDNSGEQILPLIFSDNYFSLMPGESQTISMEFWNADTRGERPVVSVEGINAE